MSQDARNSIYLWAGGIAFALLFWLTLRIDLFEGVPIEWLQGALAIAGLVSLFRFARGLWSRRSREGKSQTHG